MRVYFFTDLDNSLFQSFRRGKQSNEEDRYNIQSVISSKKYTVVDWIENRAICYMTPQQKKLLQVFSNAQVIPVTARNLDAFNRVTIPFTHGAILNYGATILFPDGKEDMEWYQKVEHNLDVFQNPLEKLSKDINMFAKNNSISIRSKMIGNAEKHFYLSIKNQDSTHDFLPELQKHACNFLNSSLQWKVHCNVNDLAFIPDCINKAHAVEYFIKTNISSLGADYLTFGLGDSNTDIDFMNKCHYALIPAQSQINRDKLYA